MQIPVYPSKQSSVENINYNSIYNILEIETEIWCLTSGGPHTSKSICPDKDYKTLIHACYTLLSLVWPPPLAITCTAVEGIRHRNPMNNKTACMSLLPIFLT